MKLIGRGQFTKCYLNDDGKTCTLKSTCCIKECMSLGWFPKHRLFPKIVREDFQVYTMEYYPRVRSLKKSLIPMDYDFYKILRDLWQSRPPMSRGVMLIDHNRDMFDKIPDVFAEERQVLLEALDACSNYGHNINFEISPRNVRVKDSRLVLMDVFFIPPGM